MPCTQARPLRSGAWSTCGQGDQSTSLRPGKVMLTVSKETTSSSVPQILENASMTPGSL